MAKKEYSILSKTEASLSDVMSYSGDPYSFGERVSYPSAVDSVYFKQC